jgi:hypothetical protein
MAGFGPTGSAQNGTIVTPGTLAYSPPLRTLYVGGAGSVTLVMSQTGTVTLETLAAGTFVDGLEIVQVTSATATPLIGFF